jgi:hypothetical protein
MKILTANSEPIKNDSWWNEKVDASQILLFIFIIANGPIADYFSQWISRYVSQIVLFFVFFTILEFITKKKSQTFDFKYLLKVSGIFILAMMFWYNVETLTESLTGFLPNVVASILQVIFKIGLFIFVFFAIGSVKKNSNS